MNQNYVTILNKAYKLKDERIKLLKQQEKETQKIEQKQQEIADNQQEALKQARTSIIINIWMFSHLSTFSSNCISKKHEIESIKKLILFFLLMYIIIIVILLLKLIRINSKPFLY